MPAGPQPTVEAFAKMKFSLRSDERRNPVGIHTLASRSETRRLMMTKALLAIGAAAVALTAVSTAPAEARQHSRVCAKWRNGHCTRWANRGYTRAMARHAQWRTGYRFGPRYAYTSYRTLPRTYVSRYDLSPNYRYVYRDNYIYQVDPTTYAVTRVIDALTR
jgi:hypothetical protein